MPIRGAKPAQEPRGRYQPYIDAICQAGGYPLPVYEYQFHPVRKWRLDVAWLGNLAGVAVEVNGGAFTQGRHTRGNGYLSDLEKLNQAQLLGWTVLQVTPRQITDGTLSGLLDQVFK